ncbi:hypothetical protein ZIOFF_075936 [Zingiber officinale]|uniref:Uncharacterized protein n=1 Tax=Zingiber officinale TaxID=94328 RepID=A0A8J5BT39_ZINOF|nr:hypothetical protein ZIOFF_075936 [Zingiber officinale]
MMLQDRLKPPMPVLKLFTRTVSADGADAKGYLNTLLTLSAPISHHHQADVEYRHEARPRRSPNSVSFSSDHLLASCRDAARDHHHPGRAMRQPDRHGVLEVALPRARDRQGRPPRRFRHSGSFSDFFEDFS